MAIPSPYEDSRGFFEAIDLLHGTKRKANERERATSERDRVATERDRAVSRMKVDLKSVMARLNDSKDVEAAGSFLASHGIRVENPWPMLEGVARLTRQDISAVEAGTFDPATSLAARNDFVGRTLHADKTESAQLELDQYRVGDPWYGAPRLEINIAPEDEDPEFRKATETEIARQKELERAVSQPYVPRRFGGQRPEGDAPQAGPGPDVNSVQAIMREVVKQAQSRRAGAGRAQAPAITGPAGPAPAVQRSPAAPPIPTAGAPGQPTPMPATPQELVDGQVYQTSRGPARWDATQSRFFAVGGQ